MHGGNRGGSRPPAINSVAGKEETAANIQQGKQRTITQMFFNPPPGSPWNTEFWNTEISHLKKFLRLDYLVCQNFGTLKYIACLFCDKQ